MMAPPASHGVHRMPAVDNQAVPGHKVAVPGSQEYGDAFHVLRRADAAQAGAPHGCVFERLRRIGKLPVSYEPPEVIGATSWEASRTIKFAGAGELVAAARAALPQLESVSILVTSLTPVLLQHPRR